MRSLYKELYYLLPNISSKDAFHVITYEKRILDILILGMGINTVIYSVSNGFYTDTRYNEFATNQLMKDITIMNKIIKKPISLVKQSLLYSKNNTYDRACSLCNNDADYKYENGLFVCDVCHSSFLVGDYGKADINYFYSKKHTIRRTDGIYYINDERIKIIYSYGDGLFEHITIRRDMLYTKYNNLFKDTVFSNNYCRICSVNQKQLSIDELVNKNLCHVCEKIIKKYRWKIVSPLVFILLYKLDSHCSVKLCIDVKKYCLNFI